MQDGVAGPANHTPENTWGTRVSNPQSANHKAVWKHVQYDILCGNWSKMAAVMQVLRRDFQVLITWQQEGKDLSGP